MKYFITIISLFLVGCGGGNSSSTTHSQSNNGTILQRVVLNNSQSVKCSNEVDFEVIPYGDVSVEITYDAVNNWTYILAISSAIGYGVIEDCQVIE